MAELFYDVMKRNPHLQVRVNQPTSDDPLSVRGLLVAPPQFGGQAEYNLLYDLASGASQRADAFLQQIQGLVNKASAAVGLGTNLSFAAQKQGLSQVRWTSSQHFAFTITFLLLSTREEDSRREVLVPASNIVAAPFPDLEPDSDVFIPPGGYRGIIKEGNRAKGLYSVSIGRWFAISNYLVLVESQVQHLKEVQRQGIPFQAVVSMTFQSYVIPSRNKVASWLTGQDFPEVSTKDVQDRS